MDNTMVIDINRNDSPANASGGKTFPYSESPSVHTFNTGTRLAISNQPGPLQALSSERLEFAREEHPSSDLNGMSSTAIATARAAEFVNGAHMQHANTIGAGVQSRIPLTLSPTALQATLPAPPAPQKPLLTAQRPAHKPGFPNIQYFRTRQKVQGPRQERADGRPPGLEDHSIPQRKGSIPGWDLARELDEWRPQIAPSKSLPATSAPISQPASGAAGVTIGPPPVKPLQRTKKLPKEQPAAVTVAAPTDESTGSITAASAALEKPKEKERRLSTMTEGQLMEKLRDAVDPGDPTWAYSKIKKIGQG